MKLHPGAWRAGTGASPAGMPELRACFMKSDEMADPRMNMGAMAEKSSNKTPEKESKGGEEDVM